MTNPILPAHLRAWPCVSLTLVGLALLLALPVEAQINLGFERTPSETAGRAVPGWRARNDDVAAVIDREFARSGAHSLRVSTLDEGRRGGLSQVLDARALSGDRVRVSAYVRSGAESPVMPSLRVRVDGPDGLLYIGRTQPHGAADAAGWRRIEIDAPLAAAAEHISIGGEITGRGTAWFDDFEVEALYARTLPAPSLTALRYVEQALGLIDEHAVNRAQLDWPAFRTAVMLQARGATSTDDAHLAVQFALASLGDRHSYFMSPRQMETLTDRPVGNARTARAVTAPFATLLDGGLGYLHLPGIAGGEHADRVRFAEIVQGLIAEVDAGATCGWILDLRDNQGGNLWPMLAGIGPLLGDGEIGFSLRPDGERRSIWYAQGKAGLGDYVQLRVSGTPVQVRSPGGPIAVILNDETASAAEIVAAAFAGKAGTRSFGSATAGATSATRTFPLSDGAALMLAVASVTDRSGEPLGGHIAPDEAVADAGRGQSLDEQAVIQAARRWFALPHTAAEHAACLQGADAGGQRGHQAS